MAFLKKIIAFPIGSLAKIRLILEQQNLHHNGMNLTIELAELNSAWHLHMM
jgi:hypothetical protein